MTWLVVNADDAGLAPSTDDAILAAARDGIVRSASVAANGPTAEEFVARAIAAGLDLGFHFNLTEGPSLAGPHATLTDARGRFAHAKAELWRRAVRGAIDAAEVAREMRAQWDRLRMLGAEPTHVDGHNHVHLVPAAREALRGLPAGLFVRAPLDRVPPPPVFPPELARWAREPGPWRRTDRFTGYRFAEEPSESVFLASLDAAAAVTEFMVHPGAREGSAFASSAARDRETATLTSPSLRASGESRGFRIGSFAEVPCA